MTDRPTEIPTVRALTLALTMAMALYLRPAAAQSQAASDVRPATPAQAKAVEQKAKAETGKKADNRSSTADKREAAKAALRAPKPGQFRPSGAVTITADHAELIEGNYAVYTGKVKVSSDTLTMNGDRLELRQSKNGQYTAEVTGDPARLAHAGVGPDDPPVTAHAQTIDYDSAVGTIKLHGKALLTRGSNSVDGEQINYDMNQQHVQAVGGDNGQVKMVIQPPPPKDKTDGNIP